MQEAGLKLQRVQGGKGPIEGVVGGDTVGQVEEGGEPIGPDFPELSDVVPTLGSDNDGTHRDDDDTEQRMEFGALDTRIVQSGKVPGQRERGWTWTGSNWGVCPIVRSRPRSHQLDALALRSEAIPTRLKSLSATPLNTLLARPRMKHQREVVR